MRLYRTNATPQTLSLWKDGKVLLTAAIPGGGEGWVQSDPIEVPVAAGERVVVSVGKATDQRYAADNDALPAPVEGAVTIPAGGGVFAAQPASFPRRPSATATTGPTSSFCRSDGRSSALGPAAGEEGRDRGLRVAAGCAAASGGGWPARSTCTVTGWQHMPRNCQAAISGSSIASRPRARCASR